MKFLSTNLEIFKFNSSVHGMNRRYKLKLHEPSTKLLVYQKRMYYRTIKIYDKLPDVTAELVSNKKCFLLQLKKYLIDKAFYSLEEYLEYLIQTHDVRPDMTDIVLFKCITLLYLHIMYF
jgi:hypothetical protein